MPKQKHRNQIALLILFMLFLWVLFSSEMESDKEGEKSSSPVPLTADHIIFEEAKGEAESEPNYESIANRAKKVFH